MLGEVAIVGLLFSWHTLHANPCMLNIACFYKFLFQTSSKFDLRSIIHVWQNCHISLISLDRCNDPLLCPNKLRVQSRLYGRVEQFFESTSCCMYNNLPLFLGRTGAVLPLWRLLDMTVIPSKKSAKDATDLDVVEVGEPSKVRPRVTRALLPDATTIVGLALSEYDSTRFLTALARHYPEFGVDANLVYEGNVP